MTVEYAPLAGQVVDLVRRAAPKPVVPPEPYTPVSAADDLIGLLAWCVTAAGVAGLMIVGIQMAIQINRGTPGEESDHFRGLVMVMLACLVGASAGPLVAYFGDLTL